MSDVKRTRARGKRLPPTQWIAFVVLAMVTIFAFAHKVSAQGNGPKTSSAAGASKGDPSKLVPKAGGVSKTEPAGAKADEEGATASRVAALPNEGKHEAGASAGEGDGDAKKDVEPKEGETAYQLKTAELGPKGGVPIHKDGDFRSPFADPKREAVKVHVGFMLENIDDYDIKKGEFSAYFYVSLVSEKPMPPEVALQTTNGKLETKEVLADLPTFKLYKMIGTFNNKPDLHAYPFDTQELSIELEDDSTGTDSMRLIPDLDHTFLDAGFDVAGWDLAYMRARILNHYYPDRFDNDDLYYSRYKFTLGIKRFATSAVFTVFVPALVIVLISLSGLWFPRDELEVRSNATTPMLAAAVLFHFALMQELPATAYLSRADKLMMAVYACLGLHMLSSWIWFVFDEKHTQTIFKWAKWVCAPITIGVMALGILF